VYSLYNGEISVSPSSSGRISRFREYERGPNDDDEIDDDGVVTELLFFRRLAWMPQSITDDSPFVALWHALLSACFASNHVLTDQPRPSWLVSTVSQIAGHDDIRPHVVSTASPLRFGHVLVLASESYAVDVVGSYKA
jgi:hypothetical protein